MNHSLARGILILCPLVLLLGCASHKPAELPKPVMGPGEGAIEGKLVDENGDPFDLRLASEKEDAPGSLEIRLMNADHAVVATSRTAPKLPQFVFDHVKPGAYELSVYRKIVGKRTIAGSNPITVDADQVTPVKITLHVNEEKG